MYVSYCCCRCRCLCPCPCCCCCYCARRDSMNDSLSMSLKLSLWRPHRHRHTHTDTQNYAACAYCPLVTCANRANGNTNADGAAVANANAAHMAHKLHVNLVNLDAAVGVRAKGRSHTFVIHPTSLHHTPCCFWQPVCQCVCYVSRQEERERHKEY